jgi:hypothetical protein
VQNQAAPIPSPVISENSDALDPFQRETPDYLAGALLQSLMRPLQGPFSFSFIGTLFLSFISLGLFPLALLPGRLRGFTRRERDQLYHLAQWLRVQFGSDADQVWDPTRGMNRLLLLSRVLVYGSIAAILFRFAGYLVDGGSLADLFNATIGAPTQRLQQPWLMHTDLFLWWMSWLGVGYTACWLANLGHQARIRGFVERFNTLMSGKGLAPVAIAPITLGLHPLWVITGLLCAGNGLIWAIPAALAGSAQRRYTTRESRAIRADLAQRVREILAAMRPEVRFAIPVILRRKCTTDRCWARLPNNAGFCPRCGKKVEMA